MKKGFTLVELLVAITMFIVIMTISMGSIVGIFDANRKSKSLKTVLNNLNLAVESMSREMRFGTRYHCDSTGTDVTTPLSCAGGGTYMSFRSSDGQQITYRQNDASIEKQITTSGSWIAVTAPEIIVNNITFYTFGAESGDNSQPKVIIKIQGYAGDTGKGRSDFTLQTLVSQRFLDR